MWFTVPQDTQLSILLCKQVEVQDQSSKESSPQETKSRESPGWMVMASNAEDGSPKEAEQDENRRHSLPKERWRKESRIRRLREWVKDDRKGPERVAYQEPGQITIPNFWIVYKTLKWASIFFNNTVNISLFISVCELWPHNINRLLHQTANCPQRLAPQSCSLTWALRTGSPFQRWET